jgi:hypothetical protein
VFIVVYQVLPSRQADLCHGEESGEVLRCGAKICDVMEDDEFVESSGRTRLVDWP